MTKRLLLVSTVVVSLLTISRPMFAVPLGETMCSLSDVQAFQKNIMDRTLQSPPAK